MIPKYFLKNLVCGRPSSGEDVTLGFMGDSNEPHSQKRVEDPADIDPDAG